MKLSPRQQLKSIVDATQQELSSLRDERPVFTLQLGWSNNYDDLLSGRYESSDEDKLLGKVLEKGKVVIAGRGGGGKTHLLYRTMRRATSYGFVPIFIDLKRWTGADYELWKDWTKTDLAEGANFLIDRFSSPKVSALELDWLPPTTKKLLIVDGLNELSANVGQQILHALNEISTDQIQTYVIVADRLIRRQLPSENRWALATVLPFSEAQIRAYFRDQGKAPADFRILEIPFFLNAAIKGDMVSGGRAAISHAYLKKHSGLDESQLDRLSKFAFDAYVGNRARSFEYQALEQSTGSNIAEMVLNSGVVNKLDDRFAFFSHHLVHDYLTARDLAAAPSGAWTRQTLNAISFDRSSFDVIALVLGLLRGQQANLFLRTLYDWDLYAAGYALAEADIQGDGPAKEMRTVIFAMLAEKRFDIVSATRQRANDALLVSQAPDAIPYRNASDLHEVFGAVGVLISSENWFNEWRRLFSTPLGQDISDEDLNLIADPDSVKGWTIANVVKRATLSQQQQSDLREFLTRQEAVIRWRAVHALGSFPSDTNFSRLAVVLDEDLEVDVRYGAVRSLVEMASHSEVGLRDLIFDAIAKRAGKISIDTRVSTELARALLIDPSKAPGNWLAKVKTISRYMFQVNDDMESRDVWRSVVSRAESIYVQ